METSSVYVKVMRVALSIEIWTESHTTNSRDKIVIMLKICRLRDWFLPSSLAAVRGFVSENWRQRSMTGGKLQFVIRSVPIRHRASQPLPTFQPSYLLRLIATMPTKAYGGTGLRVGRDDRAMFSLYNVLLYIQCIRCSCMHCVQNAESCRTPGRGTLRNSLESRL